MINISTLSLRVVKEKGARYDINKKITSPTGIWEIGLKVFEMEEQAEEIFCIVTLNTKNEINGVFEVSRGSLNASVVHPREVFKRAMLQNAASIALMHNHPSGNPHPSKEDIQITERLIDAGRLLGIKVIDHVIVGENFYYSLKEECDI